MICGVTFSCFDRKYAAQWLVDAAMSNHACHVCVTDAHSIVVAQDDRYFRDILNSAAMNTLDGQPTVWIARWRGFAAERVTGRELVYDVIAQDRDARIRHVFFGSTPLVTNRMIQRLCELDPRVRLEAFNPPFEALSDDELNNICQRLKSSEPTIVWVGLSTPKQQFLALRLSKSFGNAPVVAIGAGFDFVAGLKPCAPALIRLLCLEWLFRLASDPRRLFKRYAKVVPRFLILLAREIIREGNVGRTVE